MTLYVRFMTASAVGVLALGVVLTVVIDELFGDWNAARALQAELRAFTADRLRRRDGPDLAAYLEQYKARASEQDELRRRRQELDQLASVERRLGAPGAVTITPLPPADAALN